MPCRTRKKNDGDTYVICYGEKGSKSAKSSKRKKKKKSKRPPVPSGPRLPAGTHVTRDQFEGAVAGMRATLGGGVGDRVGQRPPGDRAPSMAWGPGSQVRSMGWGPGS